MTNHYSSRPTSFLSDTSSSIWTRFSTNFHKRRLKYLHHPTHSSTSFSTCTSSSSITQTSTSTTLSTTLHDDSIYEPTASYPTTTTTPITKTKDATTPLSEDNKSMFAVPPYSPTYCKSNEFPYSNFYVKLPDGRYMIRYRSGNREILGTEIIEGYML
ncbi:hypothetical protein INT45_010471 [Circinella minor]|uniref:Uncharacterized protein n=1 Tax=Circinella minor TaxID=1195481 RepID=A0A8H7VK78_9FUNG|nr:hypothetical protein INT45_010471 [Circinella minor]